MLGVDLGRGVFDTPLPTDPTEYIQANLATDAGALFSILTKFAPIHAVVHVAAIPDPTHNCGHEVFACNTQSTYNVVEATVRLAVPRLVYISSECVPGFFHAEKRVAGKFGVPAYVPIDELHPIAPQDAYAVSKYVGEVLVDAGVRRSGSALSAISIRPSWCQDVANVARNLGPLLRDASLYQPGPFAWIAIADLAAAIVLAATTPGAVAGGVHEVMYIAAAENIGSRDLAKAVEREWGAGVVPVKPLADPTVSGIDCSKARRLLGWAPQVKWSDFLTADGHLHPDVAAGKRIPGY